MAGVRLGVGVGHAHQDADLAARIGGAGDEPLAAIDHVVVAVPADPGADVGRIRARDVGLGHGEAGADLPVQEGRKPLLALPGRREQVQKLHVAGVGGGAVEDFRGPDHPAHDLGERGVLEVGKARARLIVPEARQEQVPETLCARAGLERLDHRRRPGAGFDLALPGADLGHDLLVHEGLQPGPQRLDLRRIGEVHDLLSPTSGRADWHSARGLASLGRSGGRAPLEAQAAWRSVARPLLT